MVEKKIGATEIAKQLKIGRSTIYKILQEARQEGSLDIRKNP